jgi:hypothetical protein
VNPETGCPGSGDEVRLGRTAQGLVVRTAAYRLDVDADGGTARLAAPGGPEVARLHLAAALDRLDGPDETLETGAPEVTATDPHPVIEVTRRSTRWESAAVRLVCRPGTVELSWSVRGTGTLTTAHLLAGRSVAAGPGSGHRPSGTSFRTLFSPNPGDPRALVRPAGHSAVIGVVGDARPGRGHWFFTPAPLCLALTTAEVRHPEEPAEGGWWTLAVGAPVRELTFTQLEWVPADGGFGLRLDYEGHTGVDGAFRTPAVVLTPGLADPYEGLRRHRALAGARGWAPPVRERAHPRWWSAPMFCGWGAQSHEAARLGVPARDLATQAHYDGFLAHLAARGLEPGTVVVDDKWQARYGTCEPDPGKWPDLRGWIAGRHRRGQRVLLWWPAWEWEGLPEEYCVRNPLGRPVALDPTHPGARRALAEAVTGMLGPGGLDADGLKIDFTARTPSGTALTRYGKAWGIALLHELLATVHTVAKQVKPDALVITHTPHPGFADVTDMVRLNDMLRLDDPEPDAPVVPQMLHRAAVVRASCPDVLVDTDDWCVPDLRSWREYLAVKPRLGVPALYYATHVDRTGEPLADEDYAALRETWRAWDERRGAAPAAPHTDGEPC